MTRTDQMPNRDTVPGLAANLKAAREASGMSQMQAGERAGVHHVSIAKYETEKSAPTLPVLYRLAEAYGVTVCSLLPGDEPKGKPRK